MVAIMSRWSGVIPNIAKICNAVMLATPLKELLNAIHNF